MILPRRSGVSVQRGFIVGTDDEDDGPPSKLARPSLSKRTIVVDDDYTSGSDDDDEPKPRGSTSSSSAAKGKGKAALRKPAGRSSSCSRKVVAKKPKKDESNESSDSEDTKFFQSQADSDDDDDDKSPAVRRVHLRSAFKTPLRDGDVFGDAAENISSRFAPFFKHIIHRASRHEPGNPHPAFPSVDELVRHLPDAAQSPLFVVYLKLGIPRTAELRKELPVLIYVGSATSTKGHLTGGRARVASHLHEMERYPPGYYLVSFLTLYEDVFDLKNVSPDVIVHHRRMGLIAEARAMRACGTLVDIERDSLLDVDKATTPCNLVNPLALGKWDSLRKFKVKSSETELSVWEATRAILCITGGQLGWFEVVSAMRQALVGLTSLDTSFPRAHLAGIKVVEVPPS
ncbi:hypothetical protein Q8F55_002239 [Vanrija albida]|uniref:Uncharacterized protein n=1 Tax=Vanrija albida TaxID=181172 RepID=A0ABR3QA86_9TREE